MFDIGAIELLLIMVVAILVIGPKDMPLALRTLGRWVGKLRSLSSQFRAGFDSIVREAELEEMEKKWKAQNERIMREHPDGVPGTDRAEMEPTGAYPGGTPAKVEKPAETRSRAEELDAIARKHDAAAEGARAEARAASKVEQVARADKDAPAAAAPDEAKDA